MTSAPSIILCHPQLGENIDVAIFFSPPPCGEVGDPGLDPGETGGGIADMSAEIKIPPPDPSSRHSPLRRIDLPALGEVKIGDRPA